MLRPGEHLADVAQPALARRQHVGNVQVRLARAASSP